MSNKEIFKASLPVMFGYIPLGMAYALLGVQVGLDLRLIIFASFVVYSGSGQFLLASLLGMGATLVEIFIASFLLNLRHFFYTTSLMGDITKLKFKFYTMFALTDETFAVLKTLKIDEKDRDRVYFLLPFFNQIYWIMGTILGVVLGSSLKIDYTGIEFCLVALFVVLAIELFRDNRNYKVLFLALFLGSFGLIFVPSSYMLVATLFFGFAILLGFRKKLC